MRNMWKNKYKIMVKKNLIAAKPIRVYDNEIINDNSIYINITGSIADDLFLIATALKIKYTNGGNIYIINNAFDKDATIYNNFPLINDINDINDIKEINELNINELNKKVILKGNFQDEKYFFKYRNEILQLFNSNNNKSESSIFIYSNNENDINYYIKSIEYIKSYYNDFKIYVLGDYEYIKEYIKDYINEYVTNLSDQESLILMSSCLLGGISDGKSLSWWGGYLNKNPDKFIIFPDKYIPGFIGSIKYSNNDYTTNLYDLKATTFIIPVRIDHSDRLYNFKTVIHYITYFFDTNLIIIEDGNKSHFDEIKIRPDKKNMINYEFNFNSNNIFHRTKILNKCLTKVTTPVVVNYDLDCLLPIESYIDCQKNILSNTYDIMHPFRSPPGVFYVDKSININYYNIKKINNSCENEGAGNGFIVYFDTNKYKYMKGENEEFISYGPEDHERIYRAIKLGLKYGTLNGPVYHLEHYRGTNSSSKNTYFDHNNKLYNNIQRMSLDELKKYYNI